MWTKWKRRCLRTWMDDVNVCVEWMSFMSVLVVAVSRITVAFKVADLSWSRISAEYSTDWRSVTINRRRQFTTDATSSATSFTWALEICRSKQPLRQQWMIFKWEQMRKNGKPTDVRMKEEKAFYDIIWNSTINRTTKNEESRRQRLLGISIGQREFGHVQNKGY